MNTETYNDIRIPQRIPVNRIISAFANEIDYRKVEEFTAIMREEMLSHEFPPIEGFPTIISEEDLGNGFLNGEEITEKHFGQLAWMVTDGHHRALSAIGACLPHLETKLDYNCITNQADL